MNRISFRGVHNLRILQSETTLKDNFVLQKIKILHIYGMKLQTHTYIQYMADLVNA